MERNTISAIYSWILVTALVCWIVRCGKLDGYSFPVYTTVYCPRSQYEWKNRSSVLNCTDSNGYICIPNENITGLLEFCYRYPRIPVEKGICLILKRSSSLVDAYSCSHFRNGCPNKQYWSNEIFKYPNCLSIGNGCFLAEPFCDEEGITTTGSVKSINTQDGINVYFGRTTLNTSFQRSIIAGNGDENNRWTWILVLGVFLLIFFILVCLTVIIFRRGMKKTLDVVGSHEKLCRYGLKGEENRPTTEDDLKEREIFEMERTSFIELKDTRGEDDENQHPDSVALLSQTNTTAFATENAANNTKREENEEEMKAEKSIQEPLRDCLVEENDKKLCFENDSEETSSTSEEDVSNGIRENSSHLEEKKRISLGELKRDRIGLDGYQVWKTTMSEKYQQLTMEERSVLFLLLCSDRNSFDMENRKQITERFSQMSWAVDFTKDLSESIQALQSKGFISIEDKNVTFASDDVQDETMFDYVHTNWIKSNHSTFDNVLCKMSLESSVKYLRSRGYQEGKYIRCLSDMKNLLTIIISKFGIDLLLYAIIDDKGLHSTISAKLKIPEEVLRWDLDARRRYLEYLRKGKTPIFRSRAMIVGCAGAGKTTLLERLQKKSMDEIKAIKSTVGLDVHNDIFVVQEEKGKLQVALHKCEPAINIKENVPLKSTEEIEKKKLLSILDFGGQCMYYACHQIYLSKRAFYILVLDMSKKLEDVIDEELCDQKDTMFSDWSHKDYLLFWLKSVDCYCGRKAPVILVATHAEGKSEQEILEYYKEIINTFHASSTIKEHLSFKRYFTANLPKSDEFFLENLEALEMCIVDVAKSQKQWGEEVPKDWAKFEEFILEKKETKLQRLSTLKETFDEILPLAKHEFADLLRFYNDVGLILYFSFKDPKSNVYYLESDIVILNIQWFVNSFKYVVTDSKQESVSEVLDAAPTTGDLNTFKTTGEISGTFLKAIWEKTANQTAAEYKNDMIKYMERLGLMAIEEKSDMYFIPSMNRRKIPDKVKSKIHKCNNKSPTLYFRFPVLPIFVFYRLTVLCLKRWTPLMDGKKCIYIDSAMFTFEKNILILGVSESYIQLMLYRNDQKPVDLTAFSEVKKEVKKMLSSLTKTFNNDLQYEVGYSCTSSEFGKELGDTFIKESAMRYHYGESCPLHAHAEDHDAEYLKKLLDYVKRLREIREDNVKRLREFREREIHKGRTRVQRPFLFGFQMPSQYGFQWPSLTRVQRPFFSSSDSEDSEDFQI